MSALLVAHTTHQLLAVIPPLSALSGSAAGPPAGVHADPRLVGIFLIAIGALYGVFVLATVCVIRWPVIRWPGRLRFKRLKWPEADTRRSAGAPFRAPASPAAKRLAGAHRPLVAHRAAGTHAPIAASASLSEPAPHWHLKGTQRDKVAAPSAFHDNEEWDAVEHEVSGVGLVQWDGRTVRAFAGQPEVLQRLAFHRWRYHEGRCSEFAPPGDMKRPSSGQRHAGTRESAGQPAGNTRPGPLPARRSERETPVAQPTGAGPA